ncbi:hypothetical protein MTO96_021047 [Rhipicephalus appendiculatus]
MAFIPTCINMMSVQVKVEPSRTPSLLPPEVAGADIKIEPSSPPSIPPPAPLHPDTKGPFEPPVLLPTIDSITTLTDNTEDSASAAALDSYKRTSEGATVSPLKRRIECKMCGQCFASTETLRNHWNVHTGERPYVCPVCGFKFARKATLNQHKRTHTGERPYLCSICGRGFSQTSSLATHRLTHTDERAYACLTCGLKFANKARLARHERGHTGEMPYACQMCPSKFCKKESFDRHMQLHASGVDMWHCLECGKNFTKLTSLLTHLKWHKMEKPHPCQLCPARFEKKCYLEIHMLTHTGEKPHKCTVCERHFSRPSEVRRHMRNIHDRAKITTASTVSKTEITMPSNTLTSLHPEDADMNEKEPAEAEVDEQAALKRCEASQQPRTTSVVFSETQLTGTPVIGDAFMRWWRSVDFVVKNTEHANMSPSHSKNWALKRWSLSQVSIQHAPMDIANPVANGNFICHANSGGLDLTHPCSLFSRHGCSSTVTSVTCSNHHKLFQGGPGSEPKGIISNSTLLQRKWMAACSLVESQKGSRKAVQAWLLSHERQPAYSKRHLYSHKRKSCEQITLFSCSSAKWDFFYLISSC